MNGNETKNQKEAYLKVQEIVMVIGIIVFIR